MGRWKKRIIKSAQGARDWSCYCCRWRIVEDIRDMLHFPDISSIRFCFFCIHLHLLLHRLVVVVAIDFSFGYSIIRKWEQSNCRFTCLQITLKSVRRRHLLLWSNCVCVCQGNIRSRNAAGPDSVRILRNVDSWLVCSGWTSFSMQHWNSPSIRQLALLGGDLDLTAAKKNRKRKVSSLRVLIFPRIDIVRLYIHIQPIWTMRFSFLRSCLGK